MNRWQLPKGRILGWSFIPVLVGLIVYSGYRSTVLNSSSDVPQSIMNESANSANEIPVPAPQSTGGSIVKVIKPNLQEAGLDKIEQERQFQRELELAFGRPKPTAEPLALKNFPSPVEGKVIRNVGNYYSKAFKNYIFHAGTDYALSEGTVIRATRGGKVVFAGPDAFLSQKVTLDCGEGWFVTYGGLDNLRVQEGEVVESQDALGQIGFFPGSEGESDQPQLHYEVWHEGQVQRPS